MIGFLPLMVIGGLFYPWLGLLMIPMVLFFLPLSYFKGRYWCHNLCPRGAFLDIVMAKVGLKNTMPKTFGKPWFRWIVFALLMGFVLFRLWRAGVNPLAIGAVFVSVCVATTFIAIVLGIIFRNRTWCVICPMGTLQEHLGKIKKRNP